jgi:hypothetical protein
MGLTFSAMTSNAVKRLWFQPKKALGKIIVKNRDKTPQARNTFRADAFNLSKMTCGTWGMPRTEVAASYSLYAAYCFEAAKVTSEPGRRLALLDMAQAWTELADHTHKANNPVSVRDGSTLPQPKR